MRTVREQKMATRKREAPRKASVTPMTRDNVPAKGLFVAWTMEGKVITDNVT